MLTEKSLSGLVVLVMLLAGTVLRGRFPKVPFWSVMMLCAAATLLLGLVGLDEAASVIDLDVIMLLIGMFALVGMAEHSGLLDFIANYFLSRVYDTRKLLVGSSLLFGLMSAFFVNDTVALLGPPIAVTIGKALGGRYEPVFLLLCYSITVGSVMTPIGNPQNVVLVGEVRELEGLYHVADNVLVLQREHVGCPHGPRAVGAGGRHEDLNVDRLFDLFEPRFGGLREPGPPLRDVDDVVQERRELVAGRHAEVTDPVLPLTEDQKCRDLVDPPLLGELSVILEVVDLHADVGRELCELLGDPARYFAALALELLREDDEPDLAGKLLLEELLDVPPFPLL
jgi:hypothetical protein